MHNHHESHLLHYDIQSNRDLYIIKALQSIAFGLSSLFIPILLYNNFGYGFGEIMLFYIIESFVCLITYPLSTRLLDHYGSKINIITGLSFMIIGFGIRATMPINGPIIYIIGVAKGLFTSFYRLGYHYNRSIHGKKINEGGQIATFNIIMTIIGSITPLVGGLIIDQLAYNYTFYVSILLCIVAIIVTFHSSEKHKSINITAHKILAHTKTNLFKKISIGFPSLAYVSFMGGTLWPLYIYIIIPNISKIGFITSITSIITVIILYFVGKELNRQNDRSIMQKSTRIQLMNRLARMIGSILQILNGTFITIIDTINRLTANTNHTCSSKTLYTLAEEHTTDETPENTAFYGTLIHEITIHGSRVLLFGIFAIMSMWIADNTMIYIAIICGIVAIPLQKAMLKN